MSPNPDPVRTIFDMDQETTDPGQNERFFQIQTAKSRKNLDLENYRVKL